MIGERAQHGGKLIHGGAAATQVDRHADLNETSLLQHGEIVGHEGIFILRLVGPASEDWPELAGDIDRTAGFGRICFDWCDHAHSVLPW
jgi:hypothetical protein